MIGLILALIDIPDFLNPLRRIAHGVEVLGENERVRAGETGPGTVSSRRVDTKV